jgi:hypothetical protein
VRALLATAEELEKPDRAFPRTFSAGLVRQAAGRIVALEVEVARLAADRADVPGVRTRGDRTTHLLRFDMPVSRAQATETGRCAILSYGGVERMTKVAPEVVAGELGLTAEDVIRMLDEIGAEPVTDFRGAPMVREEDAKRLVEQARAEQQERDRRRIALEAASRTHNS